DQLFVGGFRWPASQRFTSQPLAKSFVRPSAFKHNFRLVCTDSKQELFRLRGKVRPRRTSRNKAVSPMAKRQDNHSYGATSARIRDGMHTDCIGLEPGRERLTEGLRRLGWYGRPV